MPDAPAPLPLWRQLQACAQALASVQHGLSATAVLAGVAPAARAGVQAQLFHVLRHWAMARTLRRLLAPRQPPPTLDALLCTALALLERDAGARPLYTPFTLVSQTVEAAKKNPALRAHAGFLNACLRRFLRERDALRSKAQKTEAARWNHPAWWIRRVHKEYPRQWQAILHANNTHAPMVLRVNLAHCSQREYMSILSTTGLHGWTQGPAGIVLDHPCDVQRLPGFAQGMVSVQDGAAQMAAPLLLHAWVGDKRFCTSHPLRVLDACAAPGGKAAHLLEFAQANGLCVELTALEVDAERCTRIHQNLQRLDLHAQVQVADVLAPSQWSCNAPWDAILLDAPCTASGIVRRHPDVRWLRKESDIAQLAALQSNMLQTLWPLLNPGGRLLLSTCSIFHAEGQDQVRDFLMRHNDAQLLPSPGHLIPRTLSTEHSAEGGEAIDHDGFFYALFQKMAA